MTEQGNIPNTLKIEVSLDAGKTQTATMALFRGLDSCKEIRKIVLDGSLECSLLKAEMILDLFQVQSAVHKAVHLYHNKSMTTKNVHSEVLYCLSPSKNITESFKLFGVSDADTSLFAVLVNDTSGDRLNTLSQTLGAQPVPLGEADSLANKDLITKTYKITKEELSMFPLLDSVVSRIAAKEIITTGKGKR